MQRSPLGSDEWPGSTFLRMKVATSSLSARRGSAVTSSSIIGTATMQDPDVGVELLALRRELAWQGVVLDSFHAHNDKQRVRERVFNVLAGANFRIDATILDKPKTQPHLQRDPLRFYK